MAFVNSSFDRRPSVYILPSSISSRAMLLYGELEGLGGIGARIDEIRRAVSTFLFCCNGSWLVFLCGAEVDCLIGDHTSLSAKVTEAIVVGLLQVLIYKYLTVCVTGTHLLL